MLDVQVERERVHHRCYLERFVVQRIAGDLAVLCHAHHHDDVDGDVAAANGEGLVGRQEVLVVLDVVVVLDDLRWSFHLALVADEVAAGRGDEKISFREIYTRPSLRVKTQLL